MRLIRGVKPAPDELCQIYNDSCFSDWHKDCYGVRPHGINYALNNFVGRGETEKAYVELVKLYNEKGEACPISFEDFKEQDKEQEIELN